MREFHGMNDTPEHTSWRAMKDRCLNANSDCFRRYGGRGITICERWKTSFANFYADMGDKPSPKHTIERIDNNGNYEPRNCKWATRKEQGRNRNPRKALTINGVTKSMSDWARESGMTVQAISYRIKTGYKDSQIISPKRQGFHMIEEPADEFNQQVKA